MFKKSSLVTAKKSHQNFIDHYISFEFKHFKNLNGRARTREVNNRWKVWWIGLQIFLRFKKSFQKAYRKIRPKTPLPNKQRMSNLKSEPMPRAFSSFLDLLDLGLDTKAWFEDVQEPEGLLILSSNQMAYQRVNKQMITEVSTETALTTCWAASRPGG